MQLAQNVTRDASKMYINPNFFYRKGISNIQRVQQY